MKNILKNDNELISLLLEKGKEIFSSEDINEFYFHGKGNAFQIYRITSRLIQKGLITRIQRGKFILNKFSNSSSYDHYLIAMNLIKPSTIGYWSAMHYYNLTEQIPITTFVQSTNRKRISFALDDYKFISISKHKFFGIKKEWIQHSYFYITEIEKTIVDCFDRPDYAGGLIECSKALLNAKNLDVKKLISYAKKMNNSAILKRIFYLAEQFQLDSVIKHFSKNIYLSKKYSLLDPTLSDGGYYSSKWHLKINFDINKFNR